MRYLRLIVVWCTLPGLLACLHLREAVYLDLYQGEPIPFDEMIASLTKARLIYIGEVHTIERHHRFQLRVIRALDEQHIPLAVGMEMLPFTTQEHLDRWIEGALGEKEFLKLVDWKTNWSIDFDLYKPIFEYARDKRIRLLALNAPRSLVKTVARKGLSGLSDEEKGMLPPVTPSTEEHRRYLSLSLKQHKTLRGDMAQSAYEAQDVWDSTMAHYVAEYLKSSEGKDKTVVILAGSGHMVYGYGIPERVSAATGLAHRIILPTSSGDITFQEEWEKYIEQITLTHEDFMFIERPLADFMFLVPLR